MKTNLYLAKWGSAMRLVVWGILLLAATLPASAAFKAVLQGRDFGATNWNGGPLSGYRELDLVQMRVLFTGGPATNYSMIISFDHTKGASRGLEDLISFSASTNVIITSTPVLNSPAGVDIWTYSLAVTVTNAVAGELWFSSPISAGAHNFGGASLNISLNSGGGVVQIQKPPLVLGNPDLALTKTGATQARTNQILTYVITYTNKLIAAQTAQGVQVFDTLPAEVAYVPNSANKGGKILGNTITWSLGNLTPGKSGVLTYKVVVTNNIPVTTTFANYAQILGSQDDATPADNAASVSTTVVVIPTPTANDDTYDTGKNQSLSIPAPGVLVNDSNALSASLLVGPSSGALTFSTNGAFTYVPNPNFLGSDFFAYRSLNSSNISGPAIVTINVTNTCFVLSTINTTTTNAPGQCGAVVNFQLPVTTGDCATFDFAPTNGSFFPVGNTTVTFTNTDGVSNAFTVTVLDTEAPSLSCPGGIMLSTAAGQCARSNVTYVVTSSDNCPGSGLLQTAGLPSGATFPVGVTTNSFRATDASGNTATCSFTVTILDNDPPVITCPANVVVAAAVGACTSNVTFTVTAADGCGNVSSLVSVPASGSVFPVGVTVVTNTATDPSGNSSVCTFTVTVIDNQSPTITCPAPVAVAANAGSCAATNVTLVTPVAADNCGVAMITNNAPASFPVGTNFVTWTAVDNSGNVTTCQQAVVVSDSQPPVITCPADISVVADLGSCTTTNVLLVAPVVTDNCSVATITNDAPAQFSVGTNIVTWTARDARGNAVTCQQRVVVRDTQPPVITCPSSIVLEADPGQCSRSNVNFTVTASDNCSGVTVISIPPSGSTFPLGTTTVTNIATDASGNQTTCTFTVNTFSVTINDTQPPVITCPTNLVLTATSGQCGRTNVTFLVTATDNCTVTNLTSTPASGSTFPVGVTTVTNIATDAGGNQAVCTFTVTVLDTQPPVISAFPAPVSVAANAGNCAATNVGLGLPTYSDNCSGDFVTNNAPVSFPVGTNIVTWGVVDNSGNVVTFQQVVVVTDTQLPVITCPADVTVAASAGSCFAPPVVLGNPTVSDNCSGVTVTNNAPAQFAVGTNVVTWTARDASGNTATCQQRVIVQDAQPPVITCPTNLVLTTSPGQCNRSNVTFLVTATDNCTLASLVSTPASGSTFPVGVTTVTNIATDANGNQTTCTFTVTIADVTAPTINCPTNMSVVFPPGVTATNVSFTVTATDACGLPTLVSVPASGSVFSAGVTTVTNTATDASGNTSTCTFTVTATVANSAPVANSQSVSTLEDTVLPITLTGSDFDANPLTFVLVSGPTNGVLTGFNANTGAVAYSPNTNFAGSDVFTFRVNDGQTNSALAMVSITITPVNDAPFANSQSLTTAEDTALPVTLTGSDIEGNTLTYGLVAGPTNGLVTGFNPATGSLIYTPGTNYTGPDAFTFRANDGTNNSAIAVVTLNVTPVNDPPVAVDDVSSTPKNTPQLLLVLLNDYDVDGDPLTIIAATATNGTVSIIGGTNLWFTPASNFVGVATVNYSITDSNGGFATAPGGVTVTVGTNVPPVANNDVVSSPEDVNLRFDPRVNDLDPDGDQFTITDLVATNGTASILGGTNVSYLPPTNFFGVVTLIYTVTDEHGATGTARITVTVTPVNDAPFANGQSLSTLEDTALPITLTGADVEGSPLTYILVSGPVNGSLSGFNTNTGALTYTPSTNFNGADSFTFRTSDGTNTSALATVSITVTPVNDAPFANGQTVSTPEDTALPITLTGSDVEGTPLTYILVGGPANGLLSGFNTNTGALTYTPSTNFNGADSFTFRTSDGTNTSAVATVSITITPVNDAPFGNSQSVSTPEDTALPITLTGSDVEGTALTFILVSGPANGSLSGFNTNTGALTYTPSTNFNGADSFTFRTSDGTNTSAVAAVSITVTPVNDAPFANGQSVSTPEDTALPITLTGSDVEGTPVTYVLVAGPTHGTLSGFNTNTGALTYQPSTNYNGADSFTFRTSDGTNTSALATVSITVTPVNDAPFANNQNVVTPEDTATPITLTGSDVEGSPLTFILVGGPAHGTLSGFNTNTGALTYLPATNYNGADALTFRVSDGTNLSAVATVSITVTPVADDPRAFGQGLTTPEDTALPITLVGTSPDGNALTYQLLSAPTHGTFVSFNTNSGVLTYLPATNYNGGDAFTFRVSDGVTNSLVATVNITVTPVNDLPYIVNDFTNTPSGQPVVVPPLVNDIDPDGGTLTISCAFATNGTVVIAGTNIIFNAASNFVGTATVTYCATNQTGGSGSATITVNVLPPLNPTFAFSQGVNTVNPQTGLVEQRVTVTNTSIITASAFRLLVGNINSPLGVPRTNVWLYNASGTNGDSRPYVLYNAPLNPGQFVTLTLEFVVPDRRAFTNSLEVVQVLPVTTGTNSGSGVAIDRSFLDNRVAPARVVLEWASLPGRTYTVIYSDDNLATWHAATPSVIAVNNRTQWYDDGPPKTATVPLSQGSRFYRVILAPVNQ